MAHDDYTHEAKPAAYRAEHDEYASTEKDISGSPPEQNHIPWTAKRMIAILALCTYHLALRRSACAIGKQQTLTTHRAPGIVYVGSQIILYFASAGLTDISKSLDTKLGNWMLTANTLAVAAICPFVGYITDMLGRRWVCIFGIVFLLIASIVIATAHTLGTAIVAMAIGGIGAGICELTAIAGYVEPLVSSVYTQLTYFTESLKSLLSAGVESRSRSLPSPSCPSCHIYSTTCSLRELQRGAGPSASLAYGTWSAWSEFFSAISRHRVTTSIT